MNKKHATEILKDLQEGEPCLLDAIEMIFDDDVDRFTAWLCDVIDAYEKVE